MKPLPLFCQICLLALLAALTPARAEVYKWVDENGKTHFGDTVPENEQKRAKKIDLKNVDVSEQSRREAEARAAREKSAAQSRATPAAPSQPTATPAAPKTSDPKTEYNDSQACFNRYRNANGSLKPEAAQNCSAVKDPGG